MRRKIITSFALLAFALNASAQIYFTPETSTVDPSAVPIENGIDNMEWISFAGEPFFTNRQVKNGWGKSMANSSLEFRGTNLAGLPSGEYTNQNNDWLITPEIDLRKAKNPVIEFDMLFNYGVENTNTLAIWVCTGGYESVTPTGNDPKAKPAGEWVQLVRTVNASAAKVADHFTYSLKGYAGGKIRVALHASNRLKQNDSNSRFYTISNLTIKEK